MSLRRNLAYVAGALTVVAAISGIVAWWLPSSATWLNRHGFVAWPVALVSVLLFIWAASNWHQAAQELAAARAKMQALVPADRELFAEFKRMLPKDSLVISWLRTMVDTRIHRSSDIAALLVLVSHWHDTDQHFVNSELEEAAKRFVASGMDFIQYKNAHTRIAPQRLQTSDKDTVFQYFGPNEGDDRERLELSKGLRERANKVLAAHHELYMLGSRLGL